jgi:hypothetical protein
LVALSYGHLCHCVLWPCTQRLTPCWEQGAGKPAVVCAQAHSCNPPLSKLLQMTWDLFRVVNPNVLSSKVENFSEFWQHFQDQIPPPWSPKFPPNSAKTVFAENH